MKLNLSFINEIFKILNLFRKTKFVYIEEAQSTFMVKFIKSINYIYIITLAVNDI